MHCYASKMRAFNRYNLRRVIFMFSGIFQPMHLIVILVIVLVIFGPGKLPELGEGLAKGIKSFKKGIKDSTDAVNGEHKEVPIVHKEDTAV